MSEKFYITTTLPYVNSQPHLGFALEMAQADAIARFQKFLGKEVFFNTGTDEHGLKIYRKAQEEGKEVQKYVDEYAEKFRQLMPALGISPDIHFIRTTDQHHIQACQEFWSRCFGNGDIYKKIYQVKYCVGCELEKTESDLNEQGKCLIHPHLEIESLEEENYFFRFSKYEKALLEFYRKRPDFVVPDFRFKEIKEFIKRGLQDFSVSRLKAKMPWGVPVPEAPEHVMYVWFDALINYVSTLGWPDQKSKFEEFWGTINNPKALQIAGKDNLRQQSAMWQAMLMSAGLPPSRQIIIHGFVTSGRQKMSKSLGNVADPYAIIDRLKLKGLSQTQAIDGLRYYLLREIPTFEDGDYTWERFVETYNANLANGLGNLVSRVLKMAVHAGIMNYELGIRNYEENELLATYELAKATDVIWKKIAECDQFIQKEEPFKVIKVNLEKAKKDIEHLLSELHHIAINLQPFLPQTAERILEVLKNPRQDNIPHLFPRIT
ncbi:MAG: methionine--tRNA ligase [Candidatus Doudnabacteria bacterium]|nr:methionine--tRNA ligase [Candidatus Doudnabacteria bacterium]